jgi:LysM repeat protein
MPKRSSTPSARLLAPLALVVCALAVFVVLVGSLAGGDESSPSDTAAETETADTPAAATETTKKPAPPPSYTVQEGDTLGAIAEKTGVPVETIELLNPEVDPQALIAGQELKLRE